jgi:ribosomal protein S18 acetylase RimI-like enzyme
VRIREFDLERDYDVVFALWQGEPAIHVGASDTRPEIARKLERDPDLFLVAEADGQVVGAVLGAFDGRRGMVYHLAVEAACRGRGIGTALLEALEARLRGKGCLSAYLFVADSNLEVVEFYARRGWGVMPATSLRKKFVAEA